MYRVCAAGQHADRLSREGYSYLLELDGWTLLLGVGIDRCSSMHAAEVRVALPDTIQALFSVPEDICKEVGSGWNIGYGMTQDDAWMKVYREANRQGIIRHYQIGDAACMLFKARAVVGIYENWLCADPFGLFGLPKT
jgi:aminoglycoside N3'-acetyltransferase